MKNRIQMRLLPLCMAIAVAPAFAAQSSGDAMSKAEAKQMTESFTPKAQYNLSRREAYAAYQDALKDCKGMRGSEKPSCMKEAKSNLNNDLAYAKRQMSEGSATGSSGTGSATSTSTSSDLSGSGGGAGSSESGGSSPSGSK